MPLKSTWVEVNISGVIADVTVRQTYKNEGQRTLEAIYIFPASTRAAVYGMKMTIGERTLIAEIQEREKARQNYEQAKREGKSASLLEQQRPNVFQMNVANILPSDVIEVELKYTELLIPTDSVYEFVYPTVVGPRYSNLPADTRDSRETWVENPYLHEGENPASTFDITVNVASGLPVRDATSTSHKVSINYDGPSVAVIRLDSSEVNGGNKDFIVNYRLVGGQIETGLLLFEGEKENFFLLTAQPPERVTSEQIPPREYIFIVDVSGSMNGFPLDISKKLLKDLLGRLRPTDTFNVMLFAGASRVLSNKSVPATSSAIDQAVSVIDRQEGGGGTELLPALKRALALPKSDGCSRTVVILTDGYVNVEEQTFDIIRKNLDEANMFAFGIGSSVNRYLIEGVARVGMGESFIVTKQSEARHTVQQFRKLIETPVLTDIEIDFGEFDVYEVEPPAVPDLLADRPILVFGKWRGTPGSSITVKGTTGKGPYSREIEVAEYAPSAENSALRYLWARHRIAILSDFNALKTDKNRVREITTLGLSYNLLTAYTSFIAVDSRVRVTDGKVETVKQPLPLPQGVSDTAVGGQGVLKMAARAPAPGNAMLFAELEPATEYKRNDSGETSASPKAGVGEFKIVKLSVTGGLPTDEVSDLLESGLQGINDCYRLESPYVYGHGDTVTLTIVVDALGGVLGVNMATNRKDNSDFKECLRRELAKIRFPKSTFGKKGIIKVTCIFK